jgi:hypothetical protein
VVRKSKAPSPGKRRPPVPYPSLVEGPAPQARLARLLAQNAPTQAMPMTEAELERFLDEYRDVWPDEAEIDEFIAWVHKGRREGRYD